MYVTDGVNMHKNHTRRYGFVHKGIEFLVYYHLLHGAAVIVANVYKVYARLQC